MAEYGPWSDAYTQQFIRPLIDNLIAVLQAGETAVHTEVNDGPMPPYQRWRRAQYVWTDSTKYPACSVIPRRTPTEKSKGGPAISEDHTVEILLEDVGPDPEDLAVSVMKRVAAAHIIIERAPLTALFAGYVLDNTRKPFWDIDHDYAAFFNDRKSVYKQNGSLIITFSNLMERT
jgi:hypothetical protein